MTSQSLEQKYVTLRLIKNLGRAIVSSYRRYRLAYWGAAAISVVPTMTVIYYMLTTGYPQSWGPLGTLTTLPGRLILESFLRADVWLASTHASYLRHVGVWMRLLGINFVGWLVVLIGLTAVWRVLRAANRTQAES